MERSSRVIKPETVRLQLSKGDWVEVKKRLTVGEERLVMARNLGAVNVSDGTRKPDLDVLGMGEVAMYIVDWNLLSPDGKVIPIDGSDWMGTLKTIQQNFPSDFYDELDKAIDAHKEAMEREIADAKKIEAGSAEPVAT